jgi:hypothetical protein
MPVEKETFLGRDISIHKTMIDHGSEAKAGSESDGSECPAVLSPTKPYPPVNRKDRRMSVPRMVTLEENYKVHRERQRTLECTQSISMTSGPRRVDTSARMAGEFRYEIGSGRRLFQPHD